MKPIEKLLARLDGIEKTEKGWATPCPAHNDCEASVRVIECGDGTTVVKCRKKCNLLAILATIGLTLRDLFSALPANPCRDEAAKEGRQ